MSKSNSACASVLNCYFDSSKSAHFVLRLMGAAISGLPPYSRTARGKINYDKVAIAHCSVSRKVSGVSL